MSLFSGFASKEQESKYNSTLFDLILTLAARLNASYKQSNYLPNYIILETQETFA